MDLGIKDKVAVVTASSSGLGEAITWALAREGVKLVTFARSGEKLEAIAAAVRKETGAIIVPITGDMTQKPDVERLVEATVALGGPDILVLNTGRPPLPMREVLDETDDERWDQAYKVQLWAGVLVARKLVPLMKPKGWGRVISVTSGTVKQPITKHGLSTVFRAGMTGFMKHLANEVAQYGITVNTVCPAAIGTIGLTTSYNPEERAKSIPLRRLGKPEELAGTVAFMASQQSGFITGASLQVDGGVVASLY